MHFAVPKQPNGSPKKKTKKIVEAEPVILTLSSDDEEDTQKPATVSTFEYFMLFGIMIY